MSNRVTRLFAATLTTLAMGGVTAATPSAQAAESARPRVTFETSHGSFVLELDRETAPETVANFLAYVRDGFYEGTIFHRVIAGFMIQGGGFNEDFQQPPPVRRCATRRIGAAGTTAARSPWPGPPILTPPPPSSSSTSSTTIS